MITQKACGAQRIDAPCLGSLMRSMTRLSSSGLLTGFFL